jgi:beta-galactosidase
LFLNGESLGRKTMLKNSHLEWPVKYTPGTLLARGFKAGKEVLVSKVETTGQPAAVQLAPHRATLAADGADVSVITVNLADAQGRRVPTADNAITFALTGPGKIIGVGNGDPSSHEPDQFIAPSAIWERRLFNGLAQVIVQTTKDSGEIKLTATSGGLAPATVSLISQPARPRPSVP